MKDKIIDELTEKLSKSSAPDERLKRCLQQTVSAWTDEDGTEEELREFCIKNYITDKDKLGALVKKAESSFDAVDGYMIEMYRTILVPLHLDEGEVTNANIIFGDFNPMAHLQEDFFSSKIAFLILLNFPVYSLDEKNTLGVDWSDDDWAKAMLADKFADRVPADVLRKSSLPSSRAGIYIADYNICMDKIVCGSDTGLFPKDRATRRAC